MDSLSSEVNSRNYIVIAPEDVRVKVEEEQSSENVRQVHHDDYQTSSNSEISMETETDPERRGNCDVNFPDKIEDSQSPDEFNNIANKCSDDMDTDFSIEGGLEENRRKCNGENFECEKCGIEFGQKETLDTHYRAHTKESSQTCQECDLWFPRIEDFDRHMKKHSSTKPPEICAFRENSTHSSEELVYECDGCDQKFLQKSSLKSHRRIHEKAHECTVCGRGFSLKGTLNRHYRTHTGEKPYQCDQCDMAFSAQGALYRHYRKHTGEKPYQCEVCDRAFSLKSTREKHMRLHTGEKPYQCTICDKKFSQETTLKRHVLTHAGKKAIRSFQCLLCERSFGRKDNLTAHYAKLHPGMDIPNSEVAVSDSSYPCETSEEDKKPLVCNLCFLVFESQTECNEHKLSHHGKDIDNKYTNGESDVFVCAGCQEIFDTEELWTKHIASCNQHSVTLATGVVKVEPKDADLDEEMSAKQSDDLGEVRNEELFLNSYNATNKVKTEVDHDEPNNTRYFSQFAMSAVKSETGLGLTKEKTCGISSVNNYKCSQCEKSFQHESDRAKHHEQKHARDRPHQCDQCDQRFFTSSNLKSHYRTHTGERPYKCDVCDKGFTQPHSLIIHRKTHSPEAEKSFKCELCDKAFAFQSRLDQHMRIHTGEKPYRCDICGKAFASRSNMYHHKHIHNGDKLFKCDMCDTRFNTKRSMNRHVKLHLAEKTLQCDQCEKCFKTNSQLKRHSQTHRGKMSIVEVNTGEPDSLELAEVDTGQPDSLELAEVDTGVPDSPEFAEVDTGVPDSLELAEVDTGEPDSLEFAEVDTGVPDSPEFAEVDTGEPDSLEFAEDDTGVPDSLESDHSN